MSQKVIVGLGYVAQSGKDTAADYLANEYNFKKLSFATALKEGIGRGVFGLNDRQLYGDLKEEIDEFWDKHLEIWELTWKCDGCDGERVDRHKDYQDRWKIGDQEDSRRCTTLVSCFHCDETLISEKRLIVTPRLLLQLGGTEAGREVFGQCIWVEALFRQINNSEQKFWVIPDVRFPNEAKAILDNGFLYRIDRDLAGASGGTTKHASEVSMDNWTEWSSIIDNNGTFPELYAQVDRLVKENGWK